MKYVQAIPRTNHAHWLAFIGMTVGIHFHVFSIKSGLKATFCERYLPNEANIWVETCRNTNRPANLLLLVELDSPLAPGILTWWQCLLFRRSTARRIRPTWMRSNKKMPMKMVRMEWLLDHCIESCQAFSKNHEIKENCSYIHKYIKIQTTNFSMYVWRIFHHLTPVIFFLHLSHEKTLLLSIES